MLETLILSVVSYIGTNIDDMIINIFFFSLAKEKAEVRRIVFGKYAGIGFLIWISCMGAMGLKFISIEYVRYLGVLPLCLGVKEIVSRNDQAEPDFGKNRRDSANLLWNVAIVTIANGADNIGVYTPLFSEFTMNQYVLFLAVFIVMTAAWCMFGYKVSKVPIYEKLIKKYRKVIVPSVYILLGVYILL